MYTPHSTKANKNTIEQIVDYLKSNFLFTLLTVIALTIIEFDKLTESTTNTMRRFGFIKSLDLSKTTAMGRFSSDFIEKSYSRLFWGDVYISYYQLNADSVDQQYVWHKYIEAVGEWNSHWMDYYLSFQEYYPGTDKQATAVEIQKKFNSLSESIRNFKYKRNMQIKKFKLTKQKQHKHTIDSLNTEIEIINTEMHNTNLNIIKQRAGQLHDDLYKFTTGMRKEPSNQ